MATLKQIEANRRNALQSTGPTSPDGKARSSQNAVKHGLSSNEFFLIDGEEPALEEFLAGFAADLQPDGALENELFRQLTHAAWGLRRARQLEVIVGDEEHADPLADSDAEARMARLDRHSRRLERTFHRALKELRALQTERAYRQAAANQNGQNEPILPPASPLVSLPFVIRQLEKLPPAPPPTPDPPPLEAA